MSSDRGSEDKEKTRRPAKAGQPHSGSGGPESGTVGYFPALTHQENQETCC